MIAALLFVVALQGGQVVVQGGPPPKPVPKDAPATLPDTPQGKVVKTYVEAYNKADEAGFLKAQESLMAAEALAKRPADERAKMYKRMKGNFPSLVIKRAIADKDTIRAVVLDADGNEAIFTFAFEPAAPYKIKGIAVDIGNVVR